MEDAVRAHYSMAAGDGGNFGCEDYATMHHAGKADGGTKMSAAKDSERAAKKPVKAGRRGMPPGQAAPDHGY